VDRSAPRIQKTSDLSVMEPKQKPGISKQDYGTPPAFISAVVSRFGSLSWDLAACCCNAKAPRFLDEQKNSLTVDWHLLEGGVIGCG
jgi:hypothetical protein